MDTQIVINLRAFLNDHEINDEFKANLKKWISDIFELDDEDIVIDIKRNYGGHAV